MIVVVAGAVVYAVVGQGGTKQASGARTTTTTGAPTTTTTTTAAVAEPCPPVGGAATRVTSFSKPPPNCLAHGKTYTARVVTDAGSFTIALNPSDPAVVNDFVYLARYKFYNGLIFQRVIPGFVVQGGDPNPIVTTSPQGPGYTVQGSVPAAGSYKVGTVAMAKTATQPAGAASSQYFVVTGAAGAALPPLYAVLGQVTSGLPVVKRIESSGTTSGNPTLDHYMISVTVFVS